MAKKKTTTKKVVTINKAAAKKEGPVPDLAIEEGSVEEPGIPAGPQYSKWQLRHNASRR